ncbi:MAG: hypothetical protein IJV24_08480 [Prevotella sp.]|nr:hypothetical protein [Prevotella sp.]
MYEQQILKILTDVGSRGISVSLMAKHIYNMNSTFFFTPELQEIRQAVQQYLLRNSKSPSSLIESTGKRGYYRLNTNNSADARQLMLDFRDEQAAEDAAPMKPTIDYSLDLFEDSSK